MTESNQKWYVLRAMSGKEKQVKEYIDIELEKGGDLSRYVSQDYEIGRASCRERV